ncbi:precorrin-8X methylmutase [Singulisphaera sp. GP187]|uniref:precorrin-3B C(17)-methyltransferase n=1 Tax=Singulisphaera sp. GP187 TaxID=1882752 RepID=UPI0009268050|nr:precorrin-3B C(17)-methyltransferase [Singulisphaera sp. GP187]SIO63130.1 precorrin-8X methylmutase [Singulisphaera sp. GP187]
MSLEDQTTGILYVVGLGPGSAGLLTPDASAALAASDAIVGYRGYLDLIEDRLAGKTIVGRELGEEVERARLALELAEQGRTVALISTGDAGIYGMGGVVCELAARVGTTAELVVVPGVTAACSAAARLGAPIAHDWASISLSDLLTPWDVIVRRVNAAAEADFVVALYNPASRKRTHQLAAVADRLLVHRSPETPVGLVENAYRPGERVEIVTLMDLALGKASVNMFTTVIVGSSRTFVSNGKMVTPRIYAAKAPIQGEVASRDEAMTSRAAGDQIMAESLAIIDCELGPEPTDPAERAVVRRMIHASADFEFAGALKFSPGAIDAAVKAFRGEGPSAGDRAVPASVITDVEMLKSGVRRDLAEPLGVSTFCLLNHSQAPRIAADDAITRSAAGLRLAASEVGDHVVVAIGNAPTALEETLRLIRETPWRPACVIGIPVGFVGVEASKQRLIEEFSVSGVPFITSGGRKGGTAVTAAVINALLELAGSTPRTRPVAGG